MNLQEHSSRRLFLISLLAVLLFSISLIFQPPSAYASTSGTGVMVPLYAYPGSMWQGLIHAKEAHPSVPVIAVINPSNGPGSYQDPTILAGVRSLEAVGITVVGYISTDYARVSLSSVESQIVAYRNLYGLSGVFFDQMSNVHGYESYYSSLTNYVDSHGMWLSIGNPGTGVPSSYVNTVDIIVIYENAGLPSLSVVASRTHGYSKGHFAITPYEVGSVSSSYVESASNYLGYMYITNGVYPYQYTSLPPYFSSFVSVLEGSGPPRVTLTVNAVSLNGSKLDGLWTVIKSTSGAMVASGFTTLTYSATSGDQYLVSVSNYGDQVFSHWSNGDTSNTIAVSPKQATTLTAYFSPGSGQNAVSRPSTIDAAGMGGIFFRGIFNPPGAVPHSSGVGSTGITPSPVQGTSASSFSGFNQSFFVNSVAAVVAAALLVAGILDFARRKERQIP